MYGRMQAALHSATEATTLISQVWKAMLGCRQCLSNEDGRERLEPMMAQQTTMSSSQSGPPKHPGTDVQQRREVTELEPLEDAARRRAVKGQIALAR